MLATPSVRPARPLRLLIVEEALCSTGVGHWYEYIRTIAEGCRAAGVDVTIAAHRDVEPEIRKNLGAVPVLRYSAWDRKQDSHSALRRHFGVLRHNFRLRRDVRNFLEQSAGFDCVLAPTNLAHHLLGWHLVARDCGRRKFNRLALIFVNTPGCHTSEGLFEFPRSTLFMRTALGLMARSQRDGLVTLAAETHRAVEHFRAFSGLEFALFPHVVEMSSGAGAPSAAASPALTLGSFGFARHEKGSDLLQAAARNILRDGGDQLARFVIQWGRDFMDDAGHPVGKLQELKSDARVEFIDHPLDTREYLARLNSMDGLVLPYRSRSYYNRVSRVAVEAACLGLPFVYPRNSWLADLAEKCGAGVGFEDGNLQDLVRALREFISSIKSLRARAGERRADARRYFSPQRFKSCLFNEPDEFAAMAF